MGSRVVSEKHRDKIMILTTLGYDAEYIINDIYYIIPYTENYSYSMEPYKVHDHSNALIINIMTGEILYANSNQIKVYKKIGGLVEVHNSVDGCKDIKTGLINKLNGKLLYKIDGYLDDLNNYKMANGNQLLTFRFSKTMYPDSNNKWLGCLEYNCEQHKVLSYRIGLAFIRKVGNKLIVVLGDGREVEIPLVK